MGGRKIIDKKAGIELTEQQRRFCKYYVRCLNATEAYRLAYDLPEEKESARSSACDLLTKPNILRRIDELIEIGGLNDVAVDKQLAKLVFQDADMPTKRAAIAEYNKLKQRIVDKQKVLHEVHIIPTKEEYDKLKDRL